MKGHKGHKLTDKDAEDFKRAVNDSIDERVEDEFEAVSYAIYMVRMDRKKNGDSIICRVHRSNAPEQNTTSTDKMLIGYLVSKMDTKDVEDVARTIGRRLPPTNQSMFG